MLEALRLESLPTASTSMSAQAALGMNMPRYEDASEPTVLCISIWTDLKFLPLVNTIKKMLEVEVEEWNDNEGKALIESLNAIFKEDKCVLDLESEADTMFVRVVTNVLITKTPAAILDDAPFVDLQLLHLSEPMVLLFSFFVLLLNNGILYGYNNHRD